MTDLRARLLPVAARLLARYGAPATLTRKGQASTSRYVKAGSAAASIVVVTLAVVGPEDIINDDGRLVTATVATLQDQPMTGDVLTLGGRAYLVGKVMDVAPQGEPIIWRAVLS